MTVLKRNKGDGERERERERKKEKKREKLTKMEGKTSLIRTRELSLSKFSKIVE